MKTYDSILVLGSQPDYRTWLFPSHTYASLDKAAELLQQGIAPYIAVSGDHALKYDNTGITQPEKECDMEERYLLSIGVEPQFILKEGESRDTLAQYFYLKRTVFQPHNIQSVLMITVDFRTERLRFLWDKVFGPNYPMDFLTVPYKESEVYRNDSFVLTKQQEWLADMRAGDDSWLEGKFYDDPYYQYWKAYDQAQTDPVKRHLI